MLGSPLVPCLVRPTQLPVWRAGLRPDLWAPPEVALQCTSLESPEVTSVLQVPRTQRENPCSGPAPAGPPMPLPGLPISTCVLGLHLGLGEGHRWSGLQGGAGEQRPPGPSLACGRACRLCGRPVVLVVPFHLPDGCAFAGLVPMFCHAAEGHGLGCSGRAISTHPQRAHEDPLASPGPGS